MGFDTSVLKTGVLIVAILIIAAVVLYLMAAPNSVALTGGNTANSSQGGSTGTGSGTKLSDTQYAAFANLVYSPANSSVQYEAAGFSITKSVLANGSVSVTMTPLGALGKNSTFTFPKNDSLYYIDSSIGDDSVPSSEYALADDHVVLVDSAGYIVGSVTSP